MRVDICGGQERILSLGAGITGIGEPHKVGD